MKTITDYDVAAREIVAWTKGAFENHGFKNAIVCVDGEKDSTVVAKILIDALGKDKVYGVVTPTTRDTDQSTEYTILRDLVITNIKEANLGLLIDAAYDTSMIALEQTSIGSHTKSRAMVDVKNIVLNMLHSEIPDSTVVCTKNLSDLTIGNYEFPSDIGLIAPVAGMTNTEVKELGITIGLRKELMYKKPYIAMENCPLEMRLGFKDEQIDAYVRGDLEALTDGVRMAIESRVMKSAIYKNAFKMNFYHPIIN